MSGEYLRNGEPSTSTRIIHPPPYHTPPLIISTPSSSRPTSASFAISSSVLLKPENRAPSGSPKRNPLITHNSHYSAESKSSTPRSSKLQRMKEYEEDRDGYRAKKSSEIGDVGNGKKREKVGEKVRKNESNLGGKFKNMEKEKKKRLKNDNAKKEMDREKEERMLSMRDLKPQGCVTCGRGWPWVVFEREETGKRDHKAKHCLRCLNSKSERWRWKLTMNEMAMAINDAESKRAANSAWIAEQLKLKKRKVSLMSDITNTQTILQQNPTSSTTATPIIPFELENNGTDILSQTAVYTGPNMLPYPSNHTHTIGTVSTQSPTDFQGHNTLEFTPNLNTPQTSVIGQNTSAVRSIASSVFKTMSNFASSFYSTGNNTQQYQQTAQPQQPRQVPQLQQPQQQVQQPHQPQYHQEQVTQPTQYSHPNQTLVSGNPLPIVYNWPTNTSSIGQGDPNSINVTNFRTQPQTVQPGVVYGPNGTQPNTQHQNGHGRQQSSQVGYQASLPVGRHTSYTLDEDLRSTSEPSRTVQWLLRHYRHPPNYPAPSGQVEVYGKYIATFKGHSSGIPLTQGKEFVKLVQGVFPGVRLVQEGFKFGNLASL